MTFRQIKYMVEIAKSGSINKASANLFTSQSNVSSAIRELEQELSIELFVRKNTGIELTEEGREFLSYVKPLLEQKEKIEQLFAIKREKPLLRFGISSQHYPFTTDAFVEFAKVLELDRYEMRVMETDMYSAIDYVQYSECDVGVIFMSNTTEKFIRKVLDAKDLEFHEVRRIHPRVFLGRSHPLALSREVELSSLSDYPFVIFDRENGDSIDFSEEIMLLDFKRPERIIYIHDRATFYGLVANMDAFSLGSGLLPTGYSDDRVISLPIKGNSDMMKLGWIKRKDRRMTKNMEIFAECLKNAIERSLCTF